MTRQARTITSWKVPQYEHKAYEVTLNKTAAQEVGFYKGWWIYVVDDRYRNYGLIGRRFKTVDEVLNFLAEECEDITYH